MRNSAFDEREGRDGQSRHCIGALSAAGFDATPVQSSAASPRVAGFFRNSASNGGRPLASERHRKRNSLAQRFKEAIAEKPAERFLTASARERTSRAG